jgi:hypothetical protein
MGKSGELEEARREVAVLLEYATEKARTYETAVSHSEPDMVRRMAAAALLRLPGCLRAVSVLADAELPLEANSICRTILELAIVACWIGTDRQRADKAWAKFVIDQHRGMGRMGEFLKITPKVGKIPPRERPDLKRCAEESVDTDVFPANKAATALYALLFDPLSAASHGDIRYAFLVVHGAEPEMIPQSLSDAASAAINLLIAVSVQLDFRDDLARFLQEHGLHEWKG